ncbi:MAG: extracellular solute-binding protein, partial [Lachnospiraceae bacterium]|nr:extracellular solute-binding protein [Lachnospiraceae bacterium]
MKKKILAVLLCLAMVMSVLAGCGKKEAGTSTSSNKSGGEVTESREFDITVWVANEIKELTEKQIKDFNETNTDGIKLNATVVPVSEADAATQMLTDVEAGADIFCFVQDQFARLVQGGALGRLGEQAAEFVKTNNSAGTVAAVTSGDAIYAYPMTSDNGYFCFYDKRVVSDEQIKTVEGIIEACKASGKTFCYDLENGFYDAGFYFGVGCDSTWVTDDDGEFISVNDTFNSDKGLIAAKGMYKIISSGVWNGSSEAEQFEASIPAAVVVTGPWKTEVAQSILGENLGSAKLPTYNIDGKDYQIGSFFGGKMMGVKPQADPAKGACLAKLAQYLTGEKCQVERFETAKFGPSNKVAAESDAVKADPGLTALAAQSDYAKAQCSVHGKWWDIAKAIATSIKDCGGTDAELQAINQAYFDAINAVFNVTQEEAEAFSVIGGMNGDGWATDIPMTAIAEAGDPVYY